MIITSNTRQHIRADARRNRILQAEAARDAVIKAIYTKLFDWIVAKVNNFISGGDAAAALPYVGLLDIFGFENFVHNSFEQVTRIRSNPTSSHELTCPSHRCVPFS